MCWVGLFIMFIVMGIGDRLRPRVVTGREGT
jgi:hypothetical protein